MMLQRERPTEPHDRNARRMVPYRLPDGRVVQVDASAAKDARVIGFTLVGGEIVDAIAVTTRPAVDPFLASQDVR